MHNLKIFKMNINLAVKNVVLVGEFKASLFDKYFFIKNNITTEDDILEDSIFTPEISRLITSELHVTIMPHQVVINDIQQNSDIVRATSIAKIIVGTSNLVASAMGINLHWFLFGDKNENIIHLTKDLFFNREEKISKNFFDTDDAAYGLYLSKTFKDARLKLEIKPATLSRIEDNIEEKVLTFVFNYHIDLNNDEDNNKLILSVLDESSQYYEESQRIIDIYEFK